MYLLKHANNENYDIEVNFYSTYEEAYEQMKEEAEACMACMSRELNIDRLAATVVTPNGNIYYWSIESVEVPEKKSKVLYRYTLSEADITEACAFYQLDTTADFITWAAEKIRSEFKIDEEGENDRFYHFIEKLHSIYYEKKSESLYSHTLSERKAFGDCTLSERERFCTGDCFYYTEEE